MTPKPRITSHPVPADPTFGINDIALHSGEPVSRIKYLVEIGACPDHVFDGTHGEPRWDLEGLCRWGGFLPDEERHRGGLERIDSINQRLLADLAPRVKPSAE